MKLILKNPIFIYLFVFKIILAYLFSSQYSNELFLPFLKSISYENWNPWQSYYEKGKLDAFPYHGLMLYVLAPFAFLGELLDCGVFAIKIPLLIADFIILVILIKLLPGFLINLTYLFICFKVMKMFLFNNYIYLFTNS